MCTLTDVTLILLSICRHYTLLGDFRDRAVRETAVGLGE